MNFIQFTRFQSKNNEKAKTCSLFLCRAILQQQAGYHIHATTYTTIMY
jgi:hypothetical protein